MEYSFDSDFSGHYIIYHSEKIIDNYEMNMIINNKIKHLLSTTIKRMDGSSKVYYSLSSMCSCSEYIKSKKIGYEHVKAFVENITELCEYLEKYLLSINHVIIDMDYMYVDEENRYIEFLYNPFEETDFTEGLRQVISMVLPSINHDDQATVLLTYGLMEALDESVVTADSLEAAVKGVEEELKIKDINKNYQDDYIVDNILQPESFDEVIESKNEVVGRRINIKEVITEKIEELIRKEKRTHNKKRYKERPIYQIEDTSGSKTSGK